MDQEANPEKDRGDGLNPATTTADQPAEKPHPHYDINIFKDWCKQCGICAAFCPQKCISLDVNGAPVVENSEKCTGCRWCELHCPDFAICVRERQAPQDEQGKED